MGLSRNPSSGTSMAIPNYQRDEEEWAKRTNERNEQVVNNQDEQDKELLLPSAEKSAQKGRIGLAG